MFLGLGFSSWQWCPFAFQIWKPFMFAHFNWRWPSIITPIWTFFSEPLMSLLAKPEQQTSVFAGWWPQSTNISQQYLHSHYSISMLRLFYRSDSFFNIFFINFKWDPFLEVGLFPIYGEWSNMEKNQENCGRKDLNLDQWSKFYFSALFLSLKKRKRFDIFSETFWPIRNHN